jgi:hypothetical protein
MKGRSAFALMFACVLFAPGKAAWAQDEEDEESEEAAPADGAEGEEGESATAEGEEGEEGEEESAMEESAPAATGRWPRAIIARPLTLPKGLIQAGATFGANNDFSALTLGLNAGYGVSDDLEVKLTYGLALKEFEAKGALGFEGGYKVLRGAAGGKLEVIARAGLGYSLLDEDVTPLLAGAQAQYNISDKLAVITPGQQLVISLAETTVGMVSVRPIYLQLPVAVGYQVTPEAYVQVDTTLATIEIADSANAFIFADATPVQLSAFYNAKPNLDAFVAVKTDLTNEPGDTLAFSLGAVYYLGDL